MFGAQPFKNTLGSMALLPLPAKIVFYPLVDETGAPVQLGQFDMRRSLIPMRHRKHHRLLSRIRNTKMASGLSFAQAASEF